MKTSVFVLFSWLRCLPWKNGRPKECSWKETISIFCEEAFIRLRNFGAIFELICSLVNVYLVPIQMDCLFKNGERMNLFPNRSIWILFSFLLPQVKCARVLSTLQHILVVIYLRKWMTQRNHVLFFWENKKTKQFSTMRLYDEWVCLLLSGQKDTTKVNNENWNKMFQRSFISNDMTNMRKVINVKRKYAKERDV